LLKENEMKLKQTVHLEQQFLKHFLKK